MRKDAVRGHLDLLLLGLLAEEEPLHGYAIIERLRERSGGEFDLPEGTIYPALRRLELAGQLTSRWLESATRRRRVYDLTPAGRAALREQSNDWSRFSRAVAVTLGRSAHQPRTSE